MHKNTMAAGSEPAKNHALLPPQGDVASGSRDVLRKMICNPGPLSWMRTAAPQAALPLVAVRIRDEAPSVTAAKPAAACDVSRTVLKRTLLNGVVIHVSEDLHPPNDRAHRLPTRP